MLHSASDFLVALVCCLWLGIGYVAFQASRVFMWVGMAFVMCARALMKATRP